MRGKENLGAASGAKKRMKVMSEKCVCCSSEVNISFGAFFPITPTTIVLCPDCANDPNLTLETDGRRVLVFKKLDKEKEDEGDDQD